MPIEVKVCGLNQASAVAAAVAGGARYVGFVFFPRSPRYVNSAAAAALAHLVPPGVSRVGLFVDAEADLISESVRDVPLDMLQLHGRESPSRVAAIRGRFGLPVIKAIPVQDEADFDNISEYEEVADRLLFDARPPLDATRPGGNALSFDWRLLRGRRFRRPWLLAGGLRVENLAEAVRSSGATAVDVSSGVEDAPGRKNTEKISSFLAAAAALAVPA